MPRRLLISLAVWLLIVSPAAWAETPPASVVSSSLTDSHNDQVERINELIMDVWQQFRVKPSRAATNGEWCRRIYLDLIGRIPTQEELAAYLKDRSGDRQTKLVDRLLYSEEYLAAYAEHWTTIWTNLLLGRTGGTGNRELSNREGLREYLLASFRANQPYDRLVFELVAAEGTTMPGTPQFNGATNFLANKLDDKAAQATAKTAQLFLGTQVQCTQCHNHPFNEWKQNQFWELNAFFRQTRALRRFDTGTNELSYVELTNQDFGGEGNTPAEAEVYFEQRNGILKAAFPVFLDGTALPNRSGYLSDVNRRTALAELMLQSESLDQTIVNRLWGHFLGYGFTKPVDDMGPHNPVSHPELLDFLAKEFRRSQRDLKQLMRWIVLSRPYGLSSRMTTHNVSDDPQQGQTPKFSHFYLRQMRAEELYESLLVATEAHSSRGTYQDARASQASLAAAI